MVLMPLPPSTHDSSVITLLVLSSSSVFPPSSLRSSYICQVILHLPTIPPSHHSFAISSSTLPPSSFISPLSLHLSGFPPSTQNPSFFYFFHFTLFLRVSFFPLPPLSSPHLSTRPPPGSVSPFDSSLIKSSIYSSAPSIHTIFLPLVSLRVPQSRSSE